MKHKLTHNLGLKLISVLSACLIWLLVMDSNDPERSTSYRNIPVTIKNQATITKANKTYSVVDDTDKVTVYVTARRSVHSRLSASSFTVTADLENYNEALGSVPLEVTCSDPAVSQENMRFSPASLKIELEDKVEADFGIVAKTSGEAAKGYELGRATVLNGDTIKIAGPQSLINIIGKVTVPVDISYLDENTIGLYEIRIEDKNGTQLNTSQMSNLELKNTDGTVIKDNMAEVGLEVWKLYGGVALEALVTGEPAEGYQVAEVSVSPETVNLAATEAAIGYIDGSLTLQNTFNIEGASETQEFTVDLNDTLGLMQDVRLEADVSSTVIVTVKVDKIGTKTLDVPVSSMVVENPPAGKQLVFTPADYVPVNVRSVSGRLEEISAEDIGLYVDLSEYSANGSYTLLVTATLPPGYELGEDVTIVLNVEDEEQEEEVELLTEESE
ncbi:MAG: CdaR family protein [Eubacteriales bacterium]|nr:CdaR family protein [Eubacteriales bacterium]